MANNSLLPTKEALRLLTAQLKEPVENMRHDDPEAYSWEGITHKIIERSFGEHSMNAAHFVCDVSYHPETDEEAQEQYVKRIKSKKAHIRQFIKELELLPQPDNHRPAPGTRRVGMPQRSHDHLLSKREPQFWQIILRQMRRSNH